MPSGKAAAQAGHAFLDSYLQAPYFIAKAYLSQGHGTKVVLVTDSVKALYGARDAARAAGLPHAIVVDEGHILLPHFDGDPITTALGIGPVTRDEVRGITDQFRCLK